MRDFRIVLPKSVYFPGERVEGQLIVSTEEPISCKALRVQLEHRASVHWHRGSGDQRRDYHGTRAYALERQTVWGPVHCTSLLDNAGENAVWGSPWAPNEGVVDIPLSHAFGSKVGLKVMDYDYGKKDDVLGETVVDVDRLLAAGGRPVVLPLFRRQGLFGKGAYAPQELRGQPSVVAVSATPSHLPVTTLFPHGCEGGWQQGGVRRVRIQVHGAMRLRSADVASRNDVYVQLFEMPPNAVAGTEPLPDMGGAAGKAVMPIARQLIVPFSFQLPWNMPSTIEASVPGTDYTFARCSVYANLDIAWRVDPSTRALISIVQPLLATIPRLLEPAAFEGGPVRAVYGMAAFARACPGCCACLCCCCECCSSEGALADTSNRLGDVHVMCRLDRTGLVPGTTVGLSLRVANSSPAALVLRMRFVRRFRCNTHAFGGAGPVVMAEVPQIAVLQQTIPGNTVMSLDRFPMVVPLLSPDYHGGQPFFDPSAATAAWSGDSNLGQRWKASLPEPLLWWTSLRVSVELAPGQSAVFRPYCVDIGVVMCAGASAGDPGAVVVGVPQQPQGMARADQPWADAPATAADDDDEPPQDEKSEEQTLPPFISAAEVPRVDPRLLHQRPFEMASTEAVDAVNPQEDEQCVDRSVLVYSPQYPFQGQLPPGAVVQGAGDGAFVPHPMMAEPASVGWRLEPTPGVDAPAGRDRS